MNRTYPITVMPRPSGVALDAVPVARHLLMDLIALLRERPELMDDLDSAVYGATAPDPFVPERTLPTEDLVERILSALPDAATEIRIHGPQLSRIAGTLAQVARDQAPTITEKTRQHPRAGAA